MSKVHVDNIFLVSSIGQLNNAIKLIKSGSASRQINLCVVLWTKANREIADKLSEKSHLIFQEVMRICLPINPTSGHPYTVYKCKSAYAKLFEKYELKSVWVANTNTHYSLFLNMCMECNITINYYEEGLGTYKSKEMLLNPTSRQDNLRKLGLEIKRAFLELASEFGLDRIFIALNLTARWFYRKLISPAVFLFKIVDSWFKYFCGGEVFRGVVVPYFSKPYSSYYSIHTNFSKINVVYPEYLDKEAFQGELCKLPFQQKDFILNSEELALLSNLNLPFDSDSRIYISQKYTSDSKKWALILGKTLASQSVRSLFIKFHPKEKLSERTATLNTLIAMGINVVDIDPSNSLDALKLIASLNFTNVYGLTSSVLLYGKELAPNTEFISIAPSFESIGRSMHMCIGGLETMMRDYKLLSRFAL